MFNTDEALAWLVQFMLILTRLTAMFVLSPILGRNNIPTVAKIGVSLLASFMLINFYPPAQAYPFDNVPALLFAMVMELITGFVMGFGMIVFFNIMFTAGHIIDVQIGFSMSQQFDPASGGQVPITGMLLNLVFCQSFLMADGIPRMIGMLGQSFAVIPAGKAALPAELAWTAAAAVAKCFTLSVIVAMPLLASALLCEIGLGIIVRTAPQMNVFVIGIPIKVIIGLFMLAMSVPMFVAVTGNLFDQMFDAVDEMLYMLIPQSG